MVRSCSKIPSKGDRYENGTLKPILLGAVGLSLGGVAAMGQSLTLRAEAELKRRQGFGKGMGREGNVSS
jgi:hypothetical protein